MDSSKLNNWLQIAAAVGVIAGLILVAYEIRVSNRIGIEQANAASIERWENVKQLGASPDVADLFVRAHEGEKLTRKEVFMLNNLVDVFLLTIDFDLQLIASDSLDYPEDSYYGVIQLYLGSEQMRRRWATIRYFYGDILVKVIDEALSAPNQRDVLNYLDYIRGEGEQSE